MAGLVLVFPFAGQPCPHLEYRCLQPFRLGSEVSVDPEVGPWGPLRSWRLCSPTSHSPCPQAQRGILGSTWSTLSSMQLLGLSSQVMAQLTPESLQEEDLITPVGPPQSCLVPKKVVKLSLEDLKQTAITWTVQLKVTCAGHFLSG